MAEFTPQQITWLERYIRLISDRQVQRSLGQISSLVQPWILEDPTYGVLDMTTRLGT